jgi:putative nucleotidyltransferase with HDIG domain
VRDAVVRLGTNRIFHLVLTSVVRPLSQRPIKGYDLSAGDLFKHAAAVAVGAEQVAKALGLKTPDMAFTAGLLHDLGKLILGTFIEVDLAAIRRLAFEQGLSFQRAERQVLGLDHAEAGAALLKAWNLPTSVVTAVCWHHEPQSCPDDTSIVDLVHVADSITLSIGIGAGMDGLNYEPSKEVTERLRLTAEVAEVIASNIVGCLDELRALFSMTGGR